MVKDGGFVEKGKRPTSQVFFDEKTAVLGEDLVITLRTAFFSICRFVSEVPVPVSLALLVLNRGTDKKPPHLTKIT